jgi:sulfatase maturation enzyme AslB (radical SAM superfamily)
LVGVMKKYTGVCSEINTAHRMVQKDNEAKLKDLCAKAETLIEQ